MRTLLAMVGLLFTLTIASSAIAAGYGAAGCGPGSVVVNQSNEMGHQLVASMMNMSWGYAGIPTSQMSAITSGTSNCGKSGLILAEKEPNVFVENNYQTLAKEMAAGDGEHLKTLAGLLGCAPNQTNHFATFAKENYDSIIVSEQGTPSEMLASLKKGLSSDPELAASCTKI